MQKAKEQSKQQIKVAAVVIMNLLKNTLCSNSYSGALARMKSGLIIYCCSLLLVSVSTAFVPHKRSIKLTRSIMKLTPECPEISTVARDSKNEVAILAR